MSTYINVHNGVEGTPHYSAEEIRCMGNLGRIRVSWDAVVAAMNDEIREQVHGELAPCSDAEFLARYLELAPEPLVVG